MMEIELLFNTFSELLIVSLTAAFHILKQRFVYSSMAAESPKTLIIVKYLCIFSLSPTALPPFLNVSNRTRQQTNPKT
jgi:hypothetical protein